MIEAIVFDFDGLIIETELPIYQTWLDLYTAYGQRLSLDTWQGIIGTQHSSFNPYIDLEERTRKYIDWDVVETQRKISELDLVNQKPLLPGVIEILESAKSMGLKIGLASSSYHEWVDYHLIRRNIFKYFQTIKCADDVVKTKPDPELYQQALDDLGVSASSAFAIEDSPLGALAAKRAGLYCVVVPSVLTRDMEFEAADIKLHSLDELTLQAIIDNIYLSSGNNGKPLR